MARHDQTTGSSNAIALVLSWTFVGVPLLWGISLTLTNAVKLFH